MADSGVRLSWEEAIRILNANFNFRTIPEDSNARRSYRAGENSDALDVWFKDSSIFIALPIRSGLIEGIEQLASQSGESNYCYEIFTKEQLLKAIKVVTGTASAPRALPIGESARETQSRAARVMPAKNVILYGPPGTGKTFEAARASVEICDGPNGLHGETLKARYEQLRAEGRISFVTFHQSYGYEDFVEGLRPEAKDGQITYAVRAGIFREVCNAARSGALSEPSTVGEPLGDRTTEPQSVTTQPFVLIIDEINRANISKVFGELITLLEPDKREGAENALTVKLPYSGDDFIVPSNLYIIGTMNTADRSIALLDTALRRRFDFMEIQPDPKTLGEIDGIDLAALLGALNERIEYLYDRDHAIGHAYFMRIKTIGDLEAVFRRKIIPLLQEYFYEDWSKVCAVLNDKSGLFLASNKGVPRGLEDYSDGLDSRPRYSVCGDFPHQAYRNIYMGE